MSEAIECRLATPRDAQALAKMSRDLVERGHGWSWQSNRINHCIKRPDWVVLCAEHNAPDRGMATLAGFAIMEFKDEHAHLSLLAVQPPFRRMGVARTLLNWLEASAMVAGIAQITLEVRAQNGSGRRFYAHLGYEEVEQVPRYYSGRETAYRLRKQLREPFQPDIS